MSATATLAAPARPRGLHPAGRSADRLLLRPDGGEALTHDLARWNAPATAEEQALLATVEGPVIDLGCGAGRLVFDLAARRVRALGVDSSPAAVDLARRRGATVLRRDLFGRLPGEGRWATALLFDGNIGIGGDPVRSWPVAAGSPPPRAAWWSRSTRPARGGAACPPAWSTRAAAANRSPGRWWAPTPSAGADAIGGLAGRAGLNLAAMTATASARWFADLEPAAAAA